MQEELERLKADYEALETEAVEQEAGGGVELNDALLERLRLSGLLQRCRERRPSPEDLAERQRAAVDELSDEVLKLREENAALAFKAGETEAHNVSVSSRSTRVRSAAEEMSEEVLKLRRRFFEHRRRERQSWLKEWLLTRCKSEARSVIREMKQGEKQLQELKEAVATRRANLQHAQQQVARGHEETQEEQSSIRDLNREVMVTREGCLMPARLKRETSFLMKIFDQEGGRLNTRRHLRSLEACKKLYNEVAAHAPALLPLAGRAKLEMENQFSRYLSLEEAHNRALQRLHLGVARGLLHERDKGKTLS
mmetsp:Transcript_4378/g.7761  ORF Transcript_4378/g.7761 Transcript_4378/m.7761 type:complete len:310 (-) Transcript_4378:45-974(-)